jgi:hypothetical protein
MTPALERRYRRLLRFYPAGYRAERGDEMVDTLLELSPAGRARPTVRESWSLVAGGLRARAERHRKADAGTRWRLTASLAVALTLAQYAQVAVPVRLELRDVWEMAGAGVALLAFIAGGWFLRTRHLAVAAVVLTALNLVPDVAIHLPGALLMIGYAALSRETERMPRAWLWPVALVAAHSIAAHHGLPEPLSTGLLLLIPATCLIWAIVDGRPLLALSAAMLAGLATDTWIAVLTGQPVLTPVRTEWVVLPIAALAALPALWRMWPRTRRPL